MNGRVIAAARAAQVFKRIVYSVNVVVRPVGSVWRAVCLRDRAGLLLERGEPDAREGRVGDAV